jgi:hypothetical protein
MTENPPKDIVIFLEKIWCHGEAKNKLFSRNQHMKHNIGLCHKVVVGKKPLKQDESVKVRKLEGTGEPWLSLKARPVEVDWTNYC